MPRYDFKCPNCKTEHPDILLPMDHENPGCPDCNTEMQQHFTRRNLPQIQHVKIEPFFDKGLGRWVKDSEISEICKQTDKTFASDRELDQEADKNRKYKDEKFDQEIRKGISKIAHQVHQKGQ